MSRNKRPRKAYRPRPICADTMGLARHYAAKPSAQDRGEVLGMFKDALKALREGMATEHQWSVVSGSVSVAMAIERQGIVRGLKGHILAADAALKTIYARAIKNGGGKWARATLYFTELDALAQFADLHAFQVHQLGRAEFLRAIDAAKKDVLAEGHSCTLHNNTHQTTQPERMAA